VAALANSPGKLRALLLAVAGSVLGMTILALLNHHGVVRVAALEGVLQPAGDGPPLLRLCGTGIFNDPNDYALILVLCMCVSVYALGEERIGRWRRSALIPLALFGYALVLTHSRGGLISAAAAALAFAFAGLGWRNALPITVVLGLVLMAPFWGRQTELNLDDPEDTFQARLELWSSSLDVFRTYPLLGLGQGRLSDEIGQVTHNSFLHAFAELGLLGGIVFIGAFYLAIRGLWSARPADPDLARMRPCMLATVVGYSAGMLALSRCYTAPVQLILGLTTAFLSMEGSTVRFDTRCVFRIAGVGVAFLGVTYVFIRVMIQRGV